MTVNSEVFVFNGIKLKISQPQEFVWRLQSFYGNGFEDNGAAQTLAADLKEPLNETPHRIDIADSAEEHTVVSADKSFVKITADAVEFYGADGVFKRGLTGIRQQEDGTVFTLSLTKGEKLFGTGEHFDSVQRRGKKFHIYAIDKWCRTRGNSYLPVPFFISSACSGVFINRYEHSVFDMGRRKSDEIKITQLHAPLDMYVFLNETPEKILTAYSRITGFAPMPADWCFGTVVCRYHPEFSTKEGIIAMADAMEENRFPWDAVITEGWGTFNKTRWDELKEVSENIHARGKKMMVYEQCGKYPDKAEEYFLLGDEYAVQSTEGTLLRQTRSMNLLDNFHRKKMRCLDLTNPESIQKWEKIWGVLINDVGVDGAKIDFCEQFPDKAIIKFKDGRSPFAAHHWFPTYYNTLRYRHFNERAGGGMVFARGGGIGAQRFPFVWAGDQRREFFYLRAVLKAALSTGLSGVPFISWDMAGYQPAWNLYDRLHEDKVFIRGIEFTAFSANIQTHGNVKRPYDFDEHTRSVYRAYANIHEALRPYIKEQAAISCKTGLPLLRHLFLYDTADENTYGIEDEYTLGGELLIAPVLTRGTHRDIYLPKGEWTDIFTGKAYTGGTVIKKYSAPLEIIPVFKKSGCGAVLEKCLADAGKYTDELNTFNGRKK